MKEGSLQIFQLPLKTAGQLKVYIVGCHQDNVPKHTLKLEWMNEAHTELLEWYSQISHLNPNINL